MNKNPLISIYTPTYKRDKLLRERALTSVLNQTYENWEYIIVSDGYNENLRTIMESYDDKRIRFFDIERQQPPHNYDSEKAWLLSGAYPSNFALDQVKGEWIARIDDDDIWTKDHLENLLRFAQNGNYEFVSSKHIYEKYGKLHIFEGICLKDYLKEGNSEIKVGGHSTSFYRSYLNYIKYNPMAYKQKWNRVDHANLVYQMYKANVRMGFFEEITMKILPRPGDDTIGFEAIKIKMEEKKI